MSYVLATLSISVYIMYVPVRAHLGFWKI